MADTVLVSGGSGYIAGFLIRQLVAEGWTVHTTVRSLANEAAVRQLLAVDNTRLKFFAADLNADAGWAEAMDVRDVADLHVRALKAPGLAGERFIASGRFMKLREIADVLRTQLGPQAHKVTTRNVPDWVVRVAAPFNPVAKAVVGELGSVRNQDASHAKAVLGWATRPVEQSIVDTARCLIELGIVKT